MLIRAAVVTVSWSSADTTVTQRASDDRSACTSARRAGHDERTRSRTSGPLLWFALR